MEWYCEPIGKAADRPEIERLADAISPELGRAVRRALENQLDAASLEALAQAVASGDVSEVERIVGAVAPRDAAEIGLVLQNAVWQAGQATTRAPEFTSIEFAFNRLNPALTRWLETYELDLIREIDRGTRESVRAALVRGMNGGQHPVATARQVREAIGLTERQSRAVQSYRALLETVHMRRSVKAMGLGRTIDRANGHQALRPSADGTPKDEIDQRRLRDFRYDSVIARSVNTGKALTQAQIDKQVEAYHRKYLRYRSETIARTEAIRANNVGALEAYRQAIAAGKLDARLVRKRWSIARDERTCSICNSIPGLNPKLGVPIEATFATPKGPIATPPAHPNCRCAVLVRIYEPEQLR